MAELVGLLVGFASLPALYSTCLDGFDQFRAAKSHGKDYEILVTRLDVRKPRLLQWGVGVGLMEEETRHRDPRIDRENEMQIIESLLCGIQSLLTDTEKLRSKYGLRETDETTVVDPGIALISRLRMSAFRAAYEHFTARTKKRQKEATFKSKTKWAIYDRKKFRVLIQDLDDLIKDLYQIIPIAPEFQRLMVKEDIEAVTENLATLKLVEDACDDLSDWKDAASLRVQATEMATLDRRKIEEWLADTSSRVPQQGFSAELSQTSALDATADPQDSPFSLSRKRKFHEEPITRNMSLGHSDEGQVDKGKSRSTQISSSLLDHLREPLEPKGSQILLKCKKPGQRAAVPRYDFGPHPLRSKHSLRLLRLFPATSLDLDVVCELFEAFPSDRIPYEVLSWTVDQTILDSSIYISQDDNIYSFAISSELASALRALRGEDRTRTLWVNTICINKDDVNERNRQIKIVDQIYGNADRLCIWLGETDEYMKDALNLIKGDLPSFLGMNPSSGNLISSAQQRGAFYRLTERPWFSCRWAIQEIMLSKSRLIYCGTETLRWEQFAGVVSSLVQSQNFSEFDDLQNTKASILVKVTNNIFRQSYFGGKEPVRSLEYLVSSLSLFEVSNPRDTIYSLLAIARGISPWRSGSHFSGTDVHILSAFYPDHIKTPYIFNYQWPCVDVYADFVNFSVFQADPKRALDILCRPWAPQHMSHRNRLEEGKLPSWMQDVELGAFRFRKVLLGQRRIRVNADTLVGLPAPDQTIYDAAAGKMVDRRSLRFEKRSHGHVLFVEGFVLDVVRNVYSISQSGGIPRTWPKAFGWEDYEQYPPEEFWRTLVANRGPAGKSPPTSYPAACIEAFKGSPRENSSETGEVSALGKPPQTTQFLERVQSIILNRRLMRTRGAPGKLGLGPAATQKDDLICILYGCTVPVVLRKVFKSTTEVDQEITEDEEARKIDAAVIIQGHWRAQKIRNIVRDHTKIHTKGEIIPVDDKSSSQAKALDKDWYPGKYDAILFPRRHRPNSKDWIGIQRPKKINREVPLPFYYELIGECYVHGMMDGEAILYQNKHGIKPQTFELR